MSPEEKWARKCGMAFSIAADHINVDRLCLRRLIEAGAPEPDDAHVHQIAAALAVKLGPSPTQEQVFGILKEAVRKGWRYGNGTIEQKFITIVGS